MIKAKPVVPDRYWILKEDDRKIGNIESDGNGFTVKINNQVTTFSNLGKIKQLADIDFESIDRTPKTHNEYEVYGYATSSRPYNSVYDVKHQVPLWTRDDKSKSWYAAGWFAIQQGRQRVTAFCPKLITLQRYSYLGPFKTEEQASEQCV